MTETEATHCISWWDTLSTYILYGVLYLTGRVNDIVSPVSCKEKHRKDYPQLYASFEGFYFRHIYRRARDCLHIPICSVPGNYCTILERSSPDYGWTLKLTGKRTKCINMGSYSYLGLSSNAGPCADNAVRALRRQGVNIGSPRAELGNTRYLQELDACMARFVGVEDCLVGGMGFTTNALSLPSILNQKCIVFSDEKNHASIILGLRSSGARIKVFKHNDMAHLEEVLKETFSGMQMQKRFYEKMLIAVEGLYSMEGSVPDLPALVKLKHKYKAYLYVDEAHSMGSIGPRGRGVCDYWGIDPREVDILVGTFSKAFSSFGGYIAGPRELIQYLRQKSQAQVYGAPMTPVAAAPILTSLEIIIAEEREASMTRIQQLRHNSRYFRSRLRELGFRVCGNDDTPIVPVAIPVVSKALYCVRCMREAGIAAIPVGYPATDLFKSIIRFTVSASHTKEMLDHVRIVSSKLKGTVYLFKSRRRSMLARRQEIKIPPSDGRHRLYHISYQRYCRHVILKKKPTYVDERTNFQEFSENVFRSYLWKQMK